jgi:hypothetical protein
MLNKMAQAFFASLYSLAPAVAALRSPRKQSNAR